MKKTLFTLLVLLSAVCLALDPIILDDFTKPNEWKPYKGCTVTPAEGPDGTQAITVKLPGTAERKLPFAPQSKWAWDQYQGISFSVKGDGSDCWAPIAIRYSSYSYLFFFPLKNTEWHRYSVPWHDFIPESQIDLIGEPGALPPCGIEILRLGCRWNIWYDNAKIPPHTFSIANVRLEPNVDSTRKSFKPAPFQAVLDKLKAGKPVTIQFQGDSITAGTSVADKVNKRYSKRTEILLRKWLNNPNINCINRAVGGARTNDGRAWLNRDFVAELPDLVTIWYGYNDKSGCITTAYYKKCMADYIARIAAKTQGKTAILLFATGPGKDARYTMMDDYAQAMRDLARELNIPCFDVNKCFKSVDKKHFCDTFMADTAHPNAKGHQFIADSLCDFLVNAAGIKTPKPTLE